MTCSSQKGYYERYWAEKFGEAWSPAGIKANEFETKFLDRLLSANARVLDFGCGDGSHLASYLKASERRRNYVGVDISETAIKACQSNGLCAIQYLPDSGLPFEDETFDAVVSFEVLEHIFRPDLASIEIRRVLQRGGLFIGSVPNSVYIANRIMMCAGYLNPGGSPETSLKRPWADPHIRFFNKANLEGFLEECGFTNALIYGNTFSIVDFPVVYRLSESRKSFLELWSRPFGVLGRWWPSLLSARLYFSARK